MLYRHFPKIANKEISIAAARLPLEPLGVSDLEAFGVTLAYLPADSAFAIPPGFPVSVAACIDASAAQNGVPGAKNGAPAAFAAVNAAICSRVLRAQDFLIVDFTAAKASFIGDAARAFAAAARQAVAEAKVAGFGFRFAGAAGSECLDAARTIAGASEDWAFWCADYNFVAAPSLDPLILELGGNGVPLLATDPVAGGVLSNVPPAVHEIYYSAPVPRAHDEWALRAIWENQNVLSVVLPPSSPAEFAKRCIYAGAGRANSLPSAELKVIRAAAEKLLT